MPFFQNLLVILQKLDNPLYIEERINHTTMLDKKFKYYLDHQEELIPLYDGNVIIGNQVVGAYDNREDAYYSSMEKYEPRAFMIQLRTPGDDAYTVRYYNRVSPVITAETAFSFDVPSSRVTDYTKE